MVFDISPKIGVKLLPVETSKEVLRNLIFSNTSRGKGTKTAMFSYFNKVDNQAIRPTARQISKTAVCNLVKSTSHDL